VGNSGPGAKNLFAFKNNGVLVSTRLKVVLSLFVGLSLAVIVPYIVNDQYVSSLKQRIQTISVMLDSKDVLSARNHDTKGDASYTTLKQRLSAAKSINDDTQFLYIMGRSANGEVFFIADSEQPGADGFSARDDIYPEASPGLKAMFDSGRPLVEGPTKNRGGSWLSTLAPIQDSSSSKPIAVVGMDIPSSTYLTILAVSSIIPLLASFLIGAIFVMTDRIRARRQEALRMRSELVSIASHELRTPLTGIRWGEETLMTAQLATKYKETVDTMYDSTLRLQESIEDILQIANVQAGRSQELQIVSTNITTMIEGIFATQKLPAAQKGIKLELGHGWPSKPLLINCDAQRMKRVFNNLVSNALKYSRPNTAVIVDYDRVDDKHLLTIKDHGIGIPVSEQTKVFGGFYRATNAIEHEAGGTGMGLYLSRSVIEQHGGKLWLKSTEKKGTTVYIQLPR